MILEQIRTGGDRNFAYVLGDRAHGTGMIVDPSYDPRGVHERAVGHGLTVRYVFNTHRHPDHSNGNGVMESLTGCRALAFGDVEPESGVRIEDEAVLALGDLEVRILHTPGHTPDSICLLVGDALITGDTLFVGKVGGTDFGEGAEQEYHSLHKKLMVLPDEVRVFPGHDVGVAPSSTISREKKTNPFILQPDFKAFVQLKQTWLEYKRKHGIA